MKIFIPKEIFKRKQCCDLYGDITQISGNKTKSYYIIEAIHSKLHKGDFIDSSLRCVGRVEDKNKRRKTKKCNEALYFQYDESTPHIYLDAKETTDLESVNIFLYEPERIMQITKSVETLDDISILHQLLHDFQSKDLCLDERKLSLKMLIVKGINLPLQPMTQLFISLMDSSLIISLLRRTSFYEHYKDWQKFNSSGKRDWNIAFDKILGLIVMMTLLFYIRNPGDYVIKVSHFVIMQLRWLLRSLKGSPMGLKLNVHLNNFFLDCFNYHVDLWALFLHIIEPTVQQLFVYCTLVGSMGLSFQLALFADLISIVGLHAHCFYIYAAALYKVEICGLSVLWKVVRGKRFNLLKKRVESHNYTNRQLYLATIFFTTLLFLFPTILVYYVVFTTLRLFTTSVTYLLKFVRLRILEFPLQDLYEWYNDNYRERDNIRIEFYCDMHHSSKTEGPKNRIIVFEISVQCSSLDRIFSSESGVLQELTDRDLTLKDVCKRILEGKF